MSERPQRPLALVSGATKGIGRATAVALAPDHDLLLTGRNEARLAELAAELGTTTRVHTLAASLEVPEDVLALASRALELDATVLINNAGTASSAPLARTDQAMWEQTLAINLTAPFTLCRTLVPAMVKARWGRVVNVASTAALKGYAYTAAYSASKGGLLALTRALAVELGSKGVTVNAVCPGFTDTDIVAAAVEQIADTTGRSMEQARGRLEAFNPQGRLVHPTEVASMVAYLVSDAATAVNGVALPIDGGETS